ncbi:MAG: ATP-binding cassette domain-containing protein [Sporocytophaga sp.]|uniref:ABC transporter ATP-binding protein n=1 Tax=Sporocytophaga sp. TaxID=2231183 RepID=UPI001B216F89|nr:ATP-binding cassette domain-containing protein [Sporocytophaga sp.]MBO9702407.1 ATP-binding cassette domain-containing protein [Sporocytophaga sp.]
MYKIQVIKELHSSEGKMILDVDISVKQGSFTSIVGKSGAGKTTILRMLAGLVKPDKGSIHSGGDVWFDSNTNKNKIPQERSIGFVFQDFALFPNMTVLENLKCVQSEKDEKQIKELLSLTGLTALASCRPDSLSGGQKQRLALARALVRKPKLLILDEPFSAIDQDTRIRLQQEILKIHKSYNLTTILVSHDLTEVLRLSDYVIEIGNGKIMRQGNTDLFFSNEGKTDQFRMTGQVVDLFYENEKRFANVIVGNMLIKVRVEDSMEALLRIGDIVLLSLNDFNPIIKKINT